MAELSNNACRFAAEIAWLKEAARYFSNRPTGGEDAAHWANVYNAENANKIASRLDALISANPAPMEAVAWREAVARIIDPAAFMFSPGELDDKVYSASRAHAFDRADRILQALAVIPTEGLGSSSPKSEDTHRVAETPVLGTPKEWLTHTTGVWPGPGMLRPDTEGKG